jgi:4-amino-4-deoxy-L-arabinose transferase-like glycosyltransferase
VGAVFQGSFQKEKMNNLMEWITVGAGLAIGKLIVCLGVIAIGTAIVTLLIILDEKFK